MDSQDKSFLHIFALVLGCLALLAIIFFVVSHLVAGDRFPTAAKDGLRHKTVVKRLKPVSDNYIGSAPKVAKKQTSTQSDANKSPGQKIWEGTCSACHRTGVGGAPKIGDKEEWKKHIAKGLDTLKDHALHGYHGPEGFMPPKGANPSLSDAQVIKAMKYMVGQSGGQSILK